MSPAAKNPLKSCLPPDPHPVKPTLELAARRLRRALPCVRPREQISLFAGPQLHASRRPGREFAPAARQPRRLSRGNRPCELPWHGHGGHPGCHCIEPRQLSRRGLRRRCGDGRAIAAPASRAASAASASISSNTWGASPISRSFTGWSRRIKPLGWHVVLHFDAEDILTQQDLLGRIDVPFIIDHMGTGQGGGRPRAAAVPAAARAVRHQSPGLDQGLRRRARIRGQAAVSRCGAVCARPDRRGFAANSLGHRLAAPEHHQGHAQRRRAGRSLRGDLPGSRRCGSGSWWITRRACTGAARDHRLSRSLHHRARRAAEVPRRANRRT